MLARGVRQQFRMFMPTMPMTLVMATNATAKSKATAIFRVLPRMTKWEIKEHLLKIYNLPVFQVRTMNYLGKRKRVIGRRRIAYYKYRSFKKAIVTFEDSVHDLGLGVRIPEMEEAEAMKEEANAA